jgi:hypothetical protein
MDRSLARNGEAAVIAPHVRWAEGREPTQELRMPPAVAEWLAEQGGYEGKHYAIPPYRLGSESYVPRHAEPEDAS